MSKISGNLWSKPLAGMLAALLIVAPLANAQNVRGSISGTVQDGQRALMGSVKVTLTNQDTNVRTEVETNDLGIYQFSAVNPGTYSVEFRKAGFESKTVQGVQVSISQSRTIDATLGLQQVETIVDVMDIPGGELDRGDATIQQTLPRLTLAEIPMPSSSLVPGGSRNQVRFPWMAPAIAHVPGQNETSANGHRGRENNYMLDGTGNNDESVTLPALFIPPEAVRELQVQVAPYSAEYGRNIGAQVNVVTRSGGNTLHGEFWDFFRSSALEPLSLQSRKAQLTKTPRLLDHQFGAAVGGPIVEDKTFFFGIFQGNLQRQAAKAQNSVTIPTPAGYAALQNVILRPSSPQSPASRQAVLQALSFLPDIHSQIGGFISTSSATVNGDNIQLGTFVPVIDQNQNLWYFGLRADHEIGPNDSISYRAHIDQRNTPLASGNLAFGERWGADSKYNAQNHSFSYTKILSPRLVNEARFALIRLDPSFAERDPASSTIKISSPAFTIGGTENFPQKRLEQTFQFQNVSTLVVSRHSLKFGVDISRTRLESDNAPHSKGTWVFANLENFLNNQPDSLTQLVVANSRYDFNQWKQAYFVQDDIKLTSNLTANLGLRYETSSIPLGFFGATTTDALNALVPGPVQRDTNNWGPRIGFAYKPQFSGGLLGRIFGVEQSSIRGGFGVAYDVLYYTLLANPAVNYPRNNPTQQTSVPVDVFPTLLPQTPVAPTLSSGTSFVNVPSDTQNPTSHFWSLSVQRQLSPGNVLEVGYTASRSYHLLRQGQANPGLLNPAKAALVIANCTSGAAPMPSCQDPAGFPTSPSRMDANWGSRTLLEATGKAEYHAGYVRFERKLARDIQIGINYTWSSNFSDSEEIFTSEPLLTGSSPQVPQNFLNMRNEWARSVFDRPHRVAAHYSYRIPWFADSPRALHHVFAGWQISGFTEVQSGQPFTIRIGVDALGAGSIAGARPNYNPGGILIPDPVTGNLRTFTIPLDGTGIVTAPHVVNGAGARTFLKNSMPAGGTLGRNTFRGPGFSSTNLSFMKRIPLPRETQLQIRADLINAFNHDNFANPDSNMSSPTFGSQSLAPFTDARQVLLGAKISF